ncbi:MAG: class I SAM-dependent methyltransferase [Chloroflexi bacterium]|nr:class I SAM-dependent methyltransferase [Chloroflexota bacterium]
MCRYRRARRVDCHARRNPGRGKNIGKCIPALRYRWLTPLYDFAQRWLFREAIFKTEMVKRARIEKGHRVLDLGCGTATLTILIKEMHPQAEVAGLDADPQVLQTARSKAAKAGVDIIFGQGMAFQLPYPDSSFDRVLSSLMFHHLTRENKYRAMSEVLRVLRPGGEFHLADLGKQHGLTFLIGLILARLEEGVDNVRGMLPQMLREVGFAQVEEATRFTMPYGTVSLYRGKKPT